MADELELWIVPNSNRYHQGPDAEYAKAQGWVRVVRQDIADERVREAVREAGREDDEDFIKLVRQVAVSNGSTAMLVEAIIEDVGYGAHRVDREYARAAAEAKGE